MKARIERNYRVAYSPVASTPTWSGRLDLTFFSSPRKAALGFAWYLISNGNRFNKLQLHSNDNQRVLDTLRKP